MPNPVNQAALAQERLHEINALLAHPALVCPLRRNDLMFEADHIEGYLSLLEEVALGSWDMPASTESGSIRRWKAS